MRKQTQSLKQAPTNDKFLSSQKDLLISQLKAEIFDLQQYNQDQQQAYNNLQHKYLIYKKNKFLTRYKQLQDDLENQTQNLKYQNEHNMELITHLKTEVSFNEQKHIDTFTQLMEYKEDIRNYQRVIDEQKQEIEILHQEIVLQKQKDMALMQENENLSKELDLMNRKLYIMQDNQHDQLEKSKNLHRVTEEMEMSLLHFRNENDKLKLDVSMKIDELNSCSIQLKNAQNCISALQLDLEDRNQKEEQFRKIINDKDDEIKRKDKIQQNYINSLEQLENLNSQLQKCQQLICDLEQRNQEVAYFINYLYPLACLSNLII